MGVHGLLPLLREVASRAFTRVDVRGRVAVDIPIFMYKFGYLVGTGRPLCAKMLSFANDLRLRGFEPVFVFDGKNLPAKAAEIAKRKEQHTKQLIKLLQPLPESLHIGDMDIEVEVAMKPSCLPLWEDYQAVRMCLEAAGYQIYQAKFEAEALCSFLYSTGEVSAIITEDSDVLAYLCGLVILHCNSQEETVNVHTAMEDMDLVPSQFVDLCVLLGNDFNPRIKNIGPKKSLALLKKHGTLDRILEWGRIWSPCIRALSEEDIAAMRYTRKIFQSFCGEKCDIEMPIE